MGDEVDHVVRCPSKHLAASNAPRQVKALRWHHTQITLTMDESELDQVCDSTIYALWKTANRMPDSQGAP
jgi:hypothetical protein